MSDLIERLTPEQKDEVLRLAVKVCKWAGWLSVQRGGGSVLELKAYLEKASGMEMEEFT